MEQQICVEAVVLFIMRELAPYTYIRGSYSRQRKAVADLGGVGPHLSSQDIQKDVLL